MTREISMNGSFQLETASHEEAHVVGELRYETGSDCRHGLRMYPCPSVNTYA